MAAADAVHRVEVQTFRPELAPAFSALNLDWIRRMFEVEAHDLEQLADPAASVIAPGGEVFFVLEDGHAVGCVAMIPVRAGVYELAKMAVDPACQGRGYANLLMEAAIAFARGRGAREVMLLSNTKLTPAIRLYEKYGFRTVKLGPHPDYKRTDIEMVLVL